MEQAVQIRRGLRLEYLTLGYNCIEAIVALGSGAASGSVALIGFGIDSLIEMSSGSVMLWRLNSGASNERLAQKLVGASFFGLALYVFYESVEALFQQARPEVSWPGIALATLSAVIMPFIARAKRSVGRNISSAAMVADSKQTQLCAYLSMILLGGLALNALFGWWWADPVAALAMVPIVVREGVSAWKGEGCGCGSGGCH
ncbi:MAG: cation transporter [Bryobacteraceae bacterium]|nr:cation transporter [Bryobacteraceae bacterium]